jgi:biofilm PGA synthesis N-glycosyltransferase PgaC
MSARKNLLIAALTASVVAGHIVYPIGLGFVAKLRGAERRRPVPTEWPAITVVVPAYLERGVIAEKVDNIRSNGYPGEVTVLVVADGDAQTADAARAAGASVILIEERGGKAQALNLGVGACETDWVVLTDANAEITPGSIERLVSWLSDRTVGAVAGEKLEGDGGELAYWRFASWVKRNEADLGSTIALDGGLCAVRRSVWRDIPRDISCDDFWISLDVTQQGYRVAYEPEAAVRESSIGGFALSWERRTRVLGSALWVIWRKRVMLNPLAEGSAATKIWGHKLWRSTIGPISQLALLGMAVAAVRRSPIAQLFLVGNALAAGAVYAQSKDVQLPKLLGIAAQVAYLQAVALGGMVRFVRGDRAVKWKKPAR